MTRKHFIQLADIIVANIGDFNERSIEALADFCESQNPNFDRGRWLSYIRERL